jgi:UDP-3-O-[3-hydroxymyristoyl] glucosamine N-acyltransferase
VYSLLEISNKIKGNLVGDPSLLIGGVEDISIAGPQHITFAFLPKYIPLLGKSKAGAYIVSDQSILQDKSGIVVSNPQTAMIEVLRLFETHDTPINSPEKAYVHESVKLGKNVILSPFVSIGKNSIIGDNVILGPGVVIGSNCNIGKSSIVHANTVLYHDVILGDNVIVHAGTIIGSDGFGFHTEKNTHFKIPQIKGVRIGKNVEIGSKCTIDRGSVRHTLIDSNTKIDNQVHIAHNVHIMEGCLIAGGVFIAGSTVVEKFCVFAGKSDIGPHLHVGEKTILAARSLLLKSVKGDEMYAGNPARPIKEKQKRDAIFKRIEKLEKKMS